ncbi:MAG: acetyl-CoA carboxylase biotin carboxyl carrier protein, partial [Gemmatimonadaceae bacterium]|nr:acetyl-CoA carboxylase biotin carboxyl carrier protein [Gemmatimonadaceae bacterium]
MIDLRYVKKLVEMLDESSVDSIEISSDKGMKIRISKTPQQRGAVQMAPQMAMPALLPAAAPAVAAEAGTGVEVPRVESAKSK